MKDDNISSTKEVKVPLIDLRTQYRSLRREINSTIARILDSGIYIAGTEVKQFENELSQYTQSKYAVSTANGTDSLILALLACRIRPGDEVITSPFTFFATAEAIARVGAIPVFADIDQHTYNLSPEKAEEKITDKTKAIMPVHIFGQPADMDAFMDLAERYRLYIIEDTCQSIGATYKGKPVGSIGHVGSVSFFPTKNLGGYGDGGAVLTNDEVMAKKVRLLSFHGMTKKYYHEIVGFNSRLDEIQAAILRIKLKRLTEWNHLRQEKANKYSQHMKNLYFTLPYISSDVTHVFHLYVIQSKHRKELASYLYDKGIATGNYYPCPLHLQKAFSYLNYKHGDLPIAEKVSNHTIALPIYPELTDEQQDYIISAVFEWQNKVLKVKEG